MIDWPQQLVEDIARRRAIIMLGSGVSKNSVGENGVQPPTWREFLERALNELPRKPKHIKTAIKSGDYLTACEWLKTRLDDRWNVFLRDQFLTPSFKPNKFHELIFSLDTSVYITPNFDKIFDGYVSKETNGTSIVKNYYDNDVQQLIRNGTQLILKMHGTIEAPDRMIFGRAKYAEARVSHSAFYHLVDALLLTNTFLILGCGLDDPDFQLLFENYSYRFPTAQPHFMAYAETASDDLISLVRETRKLKILRYSKAGNHKELEDSLEVLLQKVDEERQKMAASQAW